jgi:hypothetical protein
MTVSDNAVFGGEWGVAFQPGNGEVKSKAALHQPLAFSIDERLAPPLGLVQALQAACAELLRSYPTAEET